MNKLAPDLAATLEDFFADDLAWSIRFLRQLAALPPAQRPAYAAAQLATANPPRREYTANLLEQIRVAPELAPTLPAGTPVPSLFQDLCTQLAPYRSSVDEYQVARPELMEVLNQLRTRYVMILTGEEYPVALPAFVEEVSAQLQRFASEDERQELPNLLADALSQIGYGFVRQQAHTSAVEAFLAALQHCQAHQLTDKADSCRLRLAKLYKDGAKNIDLALRNILPLLEQTAHRKDGSIQLTELSLITASVYEQAKDAFEARRYLSRAEASLQALGLGFALPEAMEQALMKWCHHLFPLVSLERYRYLKEGLAQWMHAAQLHNQLAADKTSAAQWEQVFVQIFQTEKAVRALETARNAEDQQLLQEQGYLDWASPAEDADAADKEAATAFYESANAIDDLLAAEDYSAETETLIRELQLTPFCQAYPSLQMKLQWQLGDLLEETDRLSEARACYEKAFVLAATDDNLENVLHSLLLLLVTYPESAREERIGTALLGIEYTEDARQRVTTPHQRGSFLQGKDQFYGLAMLEAWKSDRLALLLRLGELVKGHTFPVEQLTDASRQLAREALAGLHNQSASKTPQQLLQDKQLLYDRLVLTEEQEARSRDPLSLVGITHGEGDHARPQVPGAGFEEQGGAGKDDLSPWQAAMIAEIELSLEPGSACLSYYQLSPDQYLIFAQHYQGEYVTVRSKFPEGRLAELLAAVSAGIVFPSGYRGRGMEPYKGPIKGGTPVRLRVEAALEELAGLLLPDEVRSVLAGCDRLYICPHRALHSLPFHVLPFAGSFLIERFAISYVPNLGVLFKKEPTSTSSTGEVVIVGTTTFPGQGLADLPGAAAEARTVADHYQRMGRPTKVFLEHNATRGELLVAEAEGGLGGAAILHLALHGEAVAGDNPMNARLFLHTGYLDGFDLSLWQLNAELVILSACYAGLRPVAGRGQAFFPGDDLFGFQAAFFTAGAKRLLGALWPVDDVVGKELMCSFHLKGDTTDYARAWQQTVVAFLAKAPPKHRSIVYWGSFFLVEASR